MNNLIQIVRAIRLLLKLVGLFAGVDFLVGLADVLYWVIVIIELIRAIRRGTEDRMIEVKKGKLLGKASKGLNTLWNLLEKVIGLMGDHSIC